MASDELAKEIKKTARIMQMQADMIDALHSALIVIGHKKPSDPAQVAIEAMARYGQILETHKATNAGAA